jgi:hypothetical protein
MRQDGVSYGNERMREAAPSGLTDFQPDTDIGDSNRPVHGEKPAAASGEKQSHRQ